MSRRLRWLLPALLCAATARAEERASWQQLTDQAMALYRQQRYAEAADVTRQALTLAEQAFGADSLPVAESLGNLAALYRVQGNTQAAAPLKERAKIIRQQHGLHGVPLGLESEAFFDEVGRHMQDTASHQQGRADQVMVESSAPLCDFDGNGTCDDADLKIIQEALGACGHETHVDAQYDPRADFDSDGCVTDKDVDVFHQFRAQQARPAAHER